MPKPRSSPSTAGVTPPRQARSRATLDRLLGAAADLLAKRRFEEATVADLVKRAGSSVGAFYTRFPDKHALLQCFDEQLFERGQQLWEQFLDPARWAEASIEEIVAALVARLVQKRRQHRGLLRSLALYVRSHPEPRFRQRAERLNLFVTRRLTTLLLARRGEIRHPAPARAIALGLSLVDSTVREAILFADAGLVTQRLTDRQLARELTRAYLAYLGVTRKERKRSSRHGSLLGSPP